MKLGNKELSYKYKNIAEEFNNGIQEVRQTLGTKLAVITILKIKRFVNVNGWQTIIAFPIHLNFFDFTQLMVVVVEVEAASTWDDCK